MSNIKFTNLKKILLYINELRHTSTSYNSVFSTIKKMLLFTFFYLLLTGIAAVIIVFSINKDVKIVTTPKVVNMKFYKAYQVLHKLNINVVIDLRYYNNIPEGIVAFQSIEPLKKIKEKRMMKLIVSLGKKSQTSISTNKILKVTSYLVNFKLPDMYETGKVKIVISDSKNSSRVVFEDVVSSTNIIKFATKVYGKGIEKIYINDGLYLEKEIE